MIVCSISYHKCVPHSIPQIKHTLCVQQNYDSRQVVLRQARASNRHLTNAETRPSAWHKIRVNWQRPASLQLGHDVSRGPDLQDGVDPTLVLPLLELHSIRRAAFHLLRSNIFPVCWKNRAIRFNLHRNSHRKGMCKYQRYCLYQLMVSLRWLDPKQCWDGWRVKITYKWLHHGPPHIFISILVDVAEELVQRSITIKFFFFLLIVTNHATPVIIEKLDTADVDI